MQDNFARLSSFRAASVSSEFFVFLLQRKEVAIYKALSGDFCGARLSEIPWAAPRGISRFLCRRRTNLKRRGICQSSRMMRLKLEEQAAFTFQCSSETRISQRNAMLFLECSAQRPTQACRSSSSFCFEGELRGDGGFPTHSSSQLTRGFPACHRVSNETDTGGAAAVRMLRIDSHSRICHSKLCVLGPLLCWKLAAQEINRHKHEVELHHWEVLLATLSISVHEACRIRLKEAA